MICTNITNTANNTNELSKKDYIKLPTTAFKEAKNSSTSISDVVLFRSCQPTSFFRSGEGFYMFQVISLYAKCIFLKGIIQRSFFVDIYMNSDDSRLT